jgi:hypothetical protein
MHAQFCDVHYTTAKNFARSPSSGSSFAVIEGTPAEEETCNASSDRDLSNSSYMSSTLADQPLWASFPQRLLFPVSDPWKESKPRRHTPQIPDPDFP